ncbi:hypothetical protein B0A48_16400 [Cryoendolithus antarcticus]|uniref:Uncharacterized protein n=1 Tax=Cryoendolithus antarcticus TaxID=1507870 RepID=A0A1V8SDW0_9PEZI|nr:hypothetical protein B0A48_16400 [Cryoendolithus antarcticus]
MADNYLTARQKEVLFLMCKCLKEKPSTVVDMDKFTELGGFENVGSAGGFLRKVLKKVTESGSGAAEAEAGKVKTGGKTRGRKVTTNEDDDEEAPSPKKKKAAAPKKGKKGKAAAEDEDREEGVEVKDEEGEEE